MTIDATNKAMGAKVREARLFRHMSQPELAKAIGCSYQQIQKYEHGHNRLSCAALYEISKALTMPPAWFFEAYGPVEAGVPPPTIDNAQRKVLADLDKLEDPLRRVVTSFIREISQVARP